MIYLIVSGLAVASAAMFGMLCAAGALGRHAARAFICSLSDRRAIRAAAALPPSPQPEPPAAPQGLTDGDEALLLAIEHTDRHPVARSNGRVLADTLRRGVPGLSDTQLAQVCIALAVHSATIAAVAEQPFLVFTDAIAMAAVDLASLERSEAL